MKKLISIAMAGCLAVSLAACGGSSSTTAASTATSTSTATSEAASSEAASSEAASSEAASSEAASSETAAADNGDSVTLTGEADGFGGKITATVVMSGDTITDVTFDGPDETPDVGGAALETLADEVVAANGTDIDAVTGATFTSQGCIDAAQAALDSQG